MKRLLVLIAVVLIATVVNVSAANKEMKEGFNWSGKGLTLTNTSSATESVSYSYIYDAKALIVMKKTKNYSDGVTTNQKLELTLYNSKCEVVCDEVELDDIEATGIYALVQTMAGGKVVLISERLKAGDNYSNTVTLYSYTIGKKGVALLADMDYNVTPLAPSGQAEQFVRATKSGMFALVTYKEDATFGAVEDTIEIYSKPDFKSCVILDAGGPASSVDYDLMMPKIFGVNNTEVTYPDPANQMVQKIDITIYK